MKREEQSSQIAYWWDKLYPLRRKFVRETILGGLDQEDLEQECFLLLNKAFERYRSEMNVPFEAYYKVVLYGWRANQNRVKARTELAFGEDEMFFLADERTNVEQSVETKILIEEVLAALNKLDSQEQQIITAYYFQNKKIGEIAKSLNKSYRFVEVKKRKALHNLKHTLLTKRHQ